MAVLYPAPADFAEVFRTLLDLVGGDARRIQTTTDGPSLGLVFPDEVFDQLVDAPAEEQPELKKRPGRPRKVQE